MIEVEHLDITTLPYQSTVVINLLRGTGDADVEDAQRVLVLGWVYLHCARHLILSRVLAAAAERRLFFS